MSVGPLEFGVLLLFLVVLGGAVLASFGIVVWGIADAARRPDSAWARAGENKVLWLVLQAGGLIMGLGIVGLVLSIVYLSTIRPKVAAAELGPPGQPQLG